ncbi:MAG TPA: alcohol dehydrogenase catalytic domain-containing protein [Candidatus Acidoferrales bacterium]|nr:alcohol dehydrogenase catalytic domain-containing protein [Candidatus Acidoferrales bacterium]
MRALVVERPGVVHLSELSRPEPGPGEVLVEVAAAGICGSDLELLQGRRPAAYVRYPVVPGHEWAGTVVRAGSGVTGLAPGDPVVAEGFRACGACDRCLEGRTNLCRAEYGETGFTHPGAFAEYVCVPARLIHRLPPGVNLEAAVLLEPAACVACGLLEVQLRPGLQVAVVGSGTLGLLAVALLRLASPARLTLVGSRAPRLALGRRLGCDEVCDINRDDPVASFGETFDLVFEAANRPEAAETALRLARRGGTVVLEGISGAASPAISADLITLKHLQVRGIFGASSSAWRWAVELFGGGLLPLGELVSHRFPLERFEAAFGALEDRSSGAVKVELVPGRME